jgi:hypothetical protein
LPCTRSASGTATSSLLHPREVFRHALKHAASAAIVAHNHPSGDPTPSPADRAVTRQLADAGRVVGVELLDHVVVGRPEADPAGRGWFSFGEAGLISGNYRLSSEVVSPMPISRTIEVGLAVVGVAAASPSPAAKASAITRSTSPPRVREKPCTARTA